MVEFKCCNAFGIATNHALPTKMLNKFLPNLSSAINNVLRATFYASLMSIPLSEEGGFSVNLTSAGYFLWHDMVYTILTKEFNQNGGPTGNRTQVYRLKADCSATEL